GEELRSTGEELRSARAELNKERAELQTEREELCKEREELRREREVLENTNKKHLERVAELSRSLQESHDAAIHTTAQLSESQAKLRSIEEQLQKIRQREMDLNKVAKENQTLVKQLSEQVSERESVLFELQTRAEKEYKKHQTEISRLHQEKLDMERKCKYQEEEREKAVSQLGELGTLKEIGEKNNVAFENDKRHLLAKVDETDRLRDQIEQQTLKITMMEKRNLEGTETLNKENQIVRENGLKVKERLEAELQALNAVLADKEDALANAAREREVFCSSAGELAAEKSALAERVQIMEQQVVTAQEETMALQKKMAKEVQSLEDRAREQAGIMAERGDAISILKSNLATLQETEKLLQSQVEDAKLSLGEKEQKLREEKKKVEEQSLALEEAMSKLAQQVELLNQDSAAVKSMLEKARANEKELETKVQTLIAEKEELKNSVVFIQNNNDQRAQAEQREQSLQAEVVTQQDTVAQLKEKLVELLRDKDTLWKKTDQLEAEKQQYFWQPDHNTKKCTSCKMEFGILTRKHHCRSCGLIFCSNC
uniref:FYVE-type domain-containing protein n=1 Tax=Petromyzon marinus TaxID=7757 RepID=S4RR47_PETMA